LSNFAESLGCKVFKLSRDVILGKSEKLQYIESVKTAGEWRKEYWGGIHQMFPQFFYDYSFYNSSPSQFGCTKFFHTRKNCGKIVERFCPPSTGRGGRE
jgi:hypothetical protein